MALSKRTSILVLAGLIVGLVALTFGGIFAGEGCVAERRSVSGTIRWCSVALALHPTRDDRARAHRAPLFVERGIAHFHSGEAALAQADFRRARSSLGPSPALKRPRQNKAILSRFDRETDGDLKALWESAQP